jgi:hypothetical protein
MSRRQGIIASSIQYSVTHSDKKPTFFGRIPGYFYVHWLTFECIREDLFEALRGTWEIKDEDYLASFGKGGKDTALKAMGDMGE